MAVTIESEPVAWQPSDNPLLYVFSSDQTGQPNFSFVVQLKINSQVVWTDKKFPEVSNKAHWDVSPIVQNFVPGPSVSQSLIVDAGTTRTIQIVVTENYGDPPTNQANNSSSVTNVFKCRLSDKDWLTTDFVTDYLAQKWLTDNPSNATLALRGHDVNLSMLVGVATLGSVKIRFYDSSSTLLYTETTPNATNDVWQINCNTTVLEAETGIPNINDVAYVEVTLNTSDTFTVRYVDDYCFDPVSVLWVNQYGAYDSYAFQHANFESGDVKQFGYLKQFGGWSGSNFTYALNSSGATTYLKENKIKGRAVTEYLTEETQNWLTVSIKAKGLEHTLYLLDGTNFPIKVTDSAYEKKKRRFTDLINETIQFEHAYTDRSILL